MTDSFHRRVLDSCPTAIAVVDGTGSIIYANSALAELTGHDLADGLHTSIFDHLHPDDSAPLIEAYLQLADQDPLEAGWAGRAWSPIHARIMDRDGAAIPVEVCGRDCSDDPAIAGVIYTLRPAHEREIFQRVLTDVAAGGGGESRLDSVMHLVSGPPLDISAAVLEIVTDDDGDVRFEIAAATTQVLRSALTHAAAQLELGPLIAGSADACFTSVSSLPAQLGADLAAIGFVDAWTVDIAAPSLVENFRLVGFTPRHHVPARGVVDALRRAADLAAVVVLRERHETLLEHAARHDQLTSLPNRRGLIEDVDLIAPGDSERAVLFVDLDGFKAVNDLHGHGTGDVVLRVLSERLRSVTRPSDLVARLGGDEFAVVISSSSSDELDAAVPSLAQRIIDIVETPVTIDAGSVAISASVGYVLVGADVDIEDALAGADRAMYTAKRAGGGRAHGQSSDRSAPGPAELT